MVIATLVEVGSADDENVSPTKEQPIIQFPESPVDNSHKRKVSNNPAGNEAGDAKKKKKEDAEKPPAPENEDSPTDAAAEQADETKPEELPEDVNEPEEKKRLDGNVHEMEISVAAVEANDDKDKKEVDDKKEAKDKKEAEDKKEVGEELLVVD